jgi:predicted permease
MDGIAYQQVSVIVPFMLVMFLGYMCGKSKVIDSGAVKTIGHVTLNYLTPFLVIDLLQIPKTEMHTSEIVWAAVSSLVIFVLYLSIAYLFFLKNKKENSEIFACAICSVGVPALAYSLLSEIPGVNAGIYTAIFIFANQLFFSILSGILLYSKKNIIKSIINLPFILGVIGILMYCFNIELWLPISNTVSLVADIVPTLSALLIGMYFSAFPASGLKLQFNTILVSVIKLMLFPILTFGICLIAHFSIESTLTFVILAGLPCGIDLSCITLYTQSQKITASATVSAVSFFLSVIFIPWLSYSACHIYSMVYPVG